MTTTPTAATVLHLRLHRADFETYRDHFAVLADTTPVVQALPPDRALLQLSGAVSYFRLPPAALADRLQTRLAARYGLVTTGGIGPNRLLATIAADTAAPGTVHTLPDDHRLQQAFLHRQDVRLLPGIGPALEKKLTRYGIGTIGELAALPPATVQRIAGAATGRLLLERTHGTDRRTVTPSGPPATIASTARFDRDVLDPDQIRQTLLHLVTDLGARLRAADQTCRALELQVTFADRSNITRSRTLPEATSHTPALRDALYSLHTRLGLQRARIRTITARAGDLGEQQSAAVQLTFDRPTESARTLEPVIDRANARFGTGTLAPAVLSAGPRRPVIGAGRSRYGSHGMFVDHRPGRA
ncbi:hypothetical protein GCM10010441_07640 [Kitasatospora paracochleata]|uniref:DNA polymerase-4 n=1 Tax=Kitasatospora paracochleata TaxID=58354 RepID=A0ABT1JBV2_9ACTN|nr:hypothetical protein [Kitasatospora paracochleata]MCP2314156.1 DNA polymerase-4 [Kitasatospora paracochleata]